MDLEEILAKVVTHSEEASRAFHAGHKDVSEQHLMDMMIETGKYFDIKTVDGGWVKGEATNETKVVTSGAKPAKNAVPAAKPAVVDPAAAAHSIGANPEGEQRSQ